MANLTTSIEEDVFTPVNGNALAIFLSENNALKLKDVRGNVGLLSDYVQQDSIDTIQDEGTPLPQRPTLNFIGANVTATDDAINNRTNVTIVGSSPTSSYGSWYDSTTQTALDVKEPTPIQYDSSDFNIGVSIDNDGDGKPTLIRVQEAGIYNVQFSLQTYRSSGGTTEKLWIWLRIKDVDVPYSSTQITFKNNTEYQVQAWNFFVPINAGDYCQLMWAVTDLKIQLVTIPSTLVPIVPDSPSVILTVSKLQ
jgi:hypothetical protein